MVGLQPRLLHGQDLKPNRDVSLGRRHRGVSHGRGHRATALALAGSSRPGRGGRFHLSDRATCQQGGGRPPGRGAPASGHVAA